MREEALEHTVTRQYEQAAVMWCQLRREFLYAAEMVEVRLFPQRQCQKDAFDGQSIAALCSDGKLSCQHNRLTHSSSRSECKGNLAQVPSLRPLPTCGRLWHLQTSIMTVEPHYPLPAQAQARGIWTSAT